MAQFYGFGKAKKRVAKGFGFVKTKFRRKTPRPILRGEENVPVLGGEVISGPGRLGAKAVGKAISPFSQVMGGRIKSALSRGVSGKIPSVFKRSYRTQSYRPPRTSKYVGTQTGGKTVQRPKRLPRPSTVQAQPQAIFREQMMEEGLPSTYRLSQSALAKAKLKVRKKITTDRPTTTATSFESPFSPAPMVAKTGSAVATTGIVGTIAAPLIPQAKTVPPPPPMISIDTMEENLIVSPPITPTAPSRPEEFEKPDEEQGLFRAPPGERDLGAPSIAPASPLLVPTPTPSSVNVPSGTGEMPFVPIQVEEEEEDKEKEGITLPRPSDPLENTGLGWGALPGLARSPAFTEEQEPAGITKPADPEPDPEPDPDKTGTQPPPFPGPSDPFWNQNFPSDPFWNVGGGYGGRGQPPVPPIIPPPPPPKKPTTPPPPPPPPPPRPPRRRRRKIIPGGPKGVDLPDNKPISRAEIYPKKIQYKSNKKYVTVDLNTGIKKVYSRPQGIGVNLGDTPAATLKVIQRQSQKPKLSRYKLGNLMIRVSSPDTIIIRKIEGLNKKMKTQKFRR